MSSMYLAALIFKIIISLLDLFAFKFQELMLLIIILRKKYANLYQNSYWIDYHS